MAKENQGGESLQSPQADETTLLDLLKKALSKELDAAALNAPQANLIEDQKKSTQLKAKLNNSLNGKRAVTVAFPECSDVMLSLFLVNNEQDDITQFFRDYFSPGQHQILGDGVVNATRSGTTQPMVCKPFGVNPEINVQWPPFWCFPPSCVTLKGNRHLYPVEGFDKQSINRLFIADVVWLYYMERMGILKILGALLDTYAVSGRLPLSNGTTDVGNPGDDQVALILEAMTRSTEKGVSSKVRDRERVYRNSPGWSSESGRKIDLDTVVNKAFSIQFHKFLQTALEYYKDKRLATAIQASINISKVSTSTLISIRETLKLLKDAFENFDYGRNYNNTLGGIVWTLSAMSLIRALLGDLGISRTFKNPDDYIPAAYDLLVLKQPATSSDSNRYIQHKECANAARDILLDLEVLDFETNIDELETWLDVIEEKVEAYRTAYRSLMGVDLSTPNATIELEA